MENWDLAQKYAEISANAYGTAAEKMTAYTDSIEAAQNRLTASIEDFALRLNSSNLIKAFYNTISYLIDNLDKLAATIGLVIVAGNASNIARAASGGLVALGGKITGFGTSINMAGRTFAGSGIKGAARGLKNAVIDSAGQAYLQKSMALYEQALLNRIASLDAETQMSAKVLQTQMLSNKADIQAVQMEYLTTNMTEQEYQAKVKATASYDTLSPALQAEIAATENLTKVKNNAAAKQAVLDNVNASNAGRTSGTRQYINNMIGGVGGMAGGMLGSVSGYNFGESLGEGWGGTGGILGGMIGMYAGGKIGSGLGSYADNYAKAYEKIGLKLGAQLGAGYNKGVAGAIQRVGATGSAIFNSFGGWAGIASIGITAATTFWSWYMKKQKEKIQEAKDQFKELSDIYTNSLNAQPEAIRYDELVKGVDALGNNISLTDEEYQEFIETSNSLAQTFPDLVVRTDEAGNSFLGLNGKVGQVTESIEEYTETVQNLAGQKLLSPEIFGQELKANKEEVRELEGELANLQIEYNNAINKANNPNESDYSREMAKQEADSLVNEIREIEQEINAVNNDYSDYTNEILRQNQYLSESYRSLADEQKTFFDSFKNEIDYTGMNTDEAIEYAESVMSELLKRLENDKSLNNAIDLYYNLDSSIPASEYEAARNEILNKMSEIFDFLELDDESRKKFLATIGFTLDGDVAIDTTNPLDTIFEEGLNSKVLDGYGEAMSRATMGQIYSVEQLQKAYEILKDSADNAVYSAEQFQYLVVRSDVKDSALTELASQYENLKDVAETSLTPIQKIQKQIIEEELDLYAEQLGAIEGKYDDIIEKVKIMGDLTYSGTSTRTPEDVLTQAEDYMNISEYLSEFSGTWDPEQLNLIKGYEDLLPSLNEAFATGDISNLKTEVQGYLNTFEDTYNQTMQEVMLTNEEVTQQGMKQHADMIQSFADNYGIDLTNFETLKEAEAYLNATTEALMEDDYEKWVDVMADYYNIDLENFATAAGYKLALNQKILQGLDNETRAQLTQQAALDYRNMTDKQKDEYGDYQGYLNTVLQDYQQQEFTKEKLEEAQKDWQDIVDAIIPNFKTGIGSAGSGSGSDSGSKDDWDLGDELESLKGLIDKEWEAMQVFDELTGKVTGETAYFDKMNNIISQQLTYYREQLANAEALGLEKAEIYDIQGKIIELEVEQANLDDERVQDELDLAEAKNYSLDVIIKINQELLKTADTEEERVEYQNQLNEAIREEFEERKRIREFEQDFIDRAMDRQSGTSWSSGGVYDELVNMKRQSYEQDAQDALRLRENWYQYYVGTYMDQGMSWDEAKKRAEQAQEVQEATQEYLEAIDNQAQLVIDSVTDKLDEIQQKIDDLEKTKPQEWTSIDQIKQFSEETIGLLEAKIPELNAALADTSMMTDEQIQDLVDQLNEVVVALHEAQIELRENIRDFQDTQFDAIVSKVEEMKQELQDEIDALEDEYDELLDPLKKANEERERAVELEDLLRAKQDAYKEKERVNMYALDIKIAI